MNTFRALVVDDEPQVRQMTARALSRLGFHCETACNGQDALEWIQSTTFDLVVTDLKMPEVNGHKLATELLALTRRPVISILTGVEEPKLAKDLTARGVERIFYKPLDFTEFASEMLCLVEQRARMAECAEAISGTCSRQHAVEPFSRLHSLPLAGESETPDVSNTHQTLLGDLFPTRSDSLTAPAAAAASDGSRNSDVHLSRALSARIETELVLTKKALNDLQRTVAAGQNSSYINVLIALGAGLVFGLITGWLSSHMLGKFAI